MSNVPIDIRNILRRGEGCQNLCRVLLEEALKIKKGLPEKGAPPNIWDHLFDDDDD